MNNTLTFEQIPSYLIELGGRIGKIESLLSHQPEEKAIEKPLGGVPEAAEFLNLEEPTIYALVQSKKIPFHKPGKKIYFYASELNTWIRSGKGKTLQELQEEAESDLLTANKRR
jgi:excisionase family DNA binding protein